MPGILHCKSSFSHGFWRAQCSPLKSFRNHIIQLGCCCVSASSLSRSLPVEMCGRSWFSLIVSLVVLFPEAELGDRLKTHCFGRVSLRTFCNCCKSQQLKTIRALRGQMCSARKARPDEVQIKLLAGETQDEHSALSTCFGLGCVLACVHVFGSLTDICCEGQVSVRMEPINRASGRTPLPAIMCCTGTLRRTFASSWEPVFTK